MVQIVPGEKPKYDGVTGCIKTMLQEEGPRAFYKGLTPRLMRIVPGQAITFMAYEAISKRVGDWPIFQSNPLPAAPVRATA
jgi:solute carrier family 25 citrate transporter 1